MKKLFLAALAMTLFFIWLNRNDEGKERAAAARPSPVPAQPSNHNWMKQSLDRAKEAAAAARKNHEAGEAP